LETPSPFFQIQNRSREVLRRLYTTPPEHLYHYTSGDGLHGILRSGHLRGSNFSFMNDRAEFTYGIRLLHTAAEDRLRSHGENDDWAQRFFELVLASAMPTDFDLYLSCFCEKGDLLSQWRGYGGQDSRYCIKFNAERLGQMSDMVSPLVKVVYDRDRQKELLDYLIDEHMAGLRPAMEKASDLENLLQIATRCLYACSIIPLAFFKDDAFAEEHEWRSILFCRPGEYTETIDFASSSGFMKPFIPLLRGRSDTDRLPAVEVIAGASRLPEQALKAARLMLMRYGYADVPVTSSRVPLSG
jgi:hypothetical protein